MEATTSRESKHPPVVSSTAARFLVAALIATAAFALYRASLLPGLDFGDTPSFQATVGSPYPTPRDAYPLYFALGGVVFRLVGGEPAHALNLASAIAGALAAGVITLLAAEISGSLVAGAGAALLFAASYTFWSQAIIAEVYALHILFVALTLLLLLAWERQPSTGRLALFFGAYALGFGNHLSMILLLPAYTAFLLAAAPGGWRSLLAGRIVALALLFAVLGALQYGWNLRTLWLLPQPPRGLLDALQRFWFDVTKSDWRDTMVVQVPRAMLADRAAMYRFDLLQQFGVAGVLAAAAGAGVLALRNRRRAMLLAGVWVVNVLFAYSYNVGDTHVFYLPSHLVVALLAAPAVAALGAGTRGRGLAAAVLVAYASARAYHDYPALDRHGDHRPAEMLQALTSGLDDEHAILLTDLNWQVENGLTYFGRVTSPIAHARTPDVMLYAPALVADNLQIGREVALTARARTQIETAYGPLLPTTADSRLAVPTLESIMTNVTPGTRYVICILKPTRDLSLDWRDVGKALTTLAGGRSVQVPDGDYIAIAGVAGRAATTAIGSNRPFRRSVTLDGLEAEIRMEAWLNTDTIRRMGFGHVVAGRHHALIVERGVSFVAMDESGRTLASAYAANIFAPEPRYLIRR